MRIGGRIQRDDGTILTGIRRKGRNNTIREPDDATVIDDSRLRMFLGGIDESIFSTMFGIDHTDLVKGGKDILQGKGDVGQILFAAGSGISDLRRVQTGLKQTCNDIFLPTGQSRKPRINAAKRQLAEHRKAIRTTQLSGRDWAGHNDVLTAALEKKRSVELRLAEAQRERHRLERVTEALPLIGQRQTLHEELMPIADAVLLADDFSERRQTLIPGLRMAEAAKKLAVDNLAEIERAITELAVPETIIHQADAIETIHQELGRHRKALKDRSKLVIRQSVLRKDARTILTGIRKDVSLDQAEVLRLGKTETIRIQELGNRHGRLVTRLASAREDMDKLAIRIDHLKKRADAFHALPDIDAMRRTIEDIRNLGPIEENGRQETARARRTERDIKTALKKQTLWQGDPDQLNTLPLPVPETIDGFEQRFNHGENGLKVSRDEYGALEKDILSIEKQLEQLRLEQEVPTEADLLDARRKRDRGWRIVRTHLAGKNPTDGRTDAFVSDFPPAADLQEAYERSVRDADDMADRLRREADRVAKKSSLLAEKKMRDALLTAAGRRIQVGESELADLHRAWRSVWQPAGITPNTPREMRIWAGTMGDLAQETTRLNESRMVIENLAAERDRSIAALRTHLDAMGQPPVSEKEALSDILARCERYADRVEKKRLEKDQVNREATERDEERRLAESRSRKAKEDLEKWQAQWQAAVSPLGLPRDATPAQAVAVVEDLKSLFDKLKEADILEKRIHGIDRDAIDFTAGVDNLVRSLAPDLAGRSAETAVVDLNSRLTRAREAMTRQMSLEKQKQGENKKRAAAENNISGMQAQLETMCQEAGCASPAELAEAEKRSEMRKDIAVRLTGTEERLIQLSGGQTVDAFIQKALSVDPDAIDTTLGRLTEEIADLEEHRSRLDQTIGQEKNELSRMDGSAQAAELEEEAQGLIAHIETDAARYVRMRLASEVLKRAIDIYREKHQGPVLERSGELFSHLTCGAFQGLRVEPGDKDEAVLVGVRSGAGELVGVDAMSEGTVDQLYLAVRLASLEMYLDNNETMPLILDDILINFDDDRAAATLEVLARLAERTQIIFFTHHTHLLALAKARVAKNRLIAHRLGND